MAVSAPTSRSDISKLREEKKRREEEARRKGQEAEAAKAKAGERKPSIGYPEKQQEEQSAPLMPRETRSDHNRRVGGQMDRMLETAGASRIGSEIDRGMQFAKGVGGSLLDAAKKGIQGARDEARAAGDSRRRAEESSKNLEEGPFSESGQQARREADALKNFDYRGAGAALSQIGGSMLSGLSDALPGMPRFDTRSSEQKQSDADGVFSEDYDRRQEAKEIQGELDSLVDDKTYQEYVDGHYPEDGPLMSREEYAYDEAYKFYKEQAEARGDVEILSPEEFVDEMSGTQQSKDGLGRERVGPMVDPDDVMGNTLSFPVRYDNLSPIHKQRLEMHRLVGDDPRTRYVTYDRGLNNLDGEVFMPNNQGDSDNAGRIRGIIDERKRRNPDEPIPVGLQAQAQAAQRDTHSGVPMTEGSGSLVAPSVNSDGSVGAKTYTRGIPREIEDAAEGLSSQAEKDMYIAQAMGVDLNQYPPEQRQAVAQKFVNEKRGLADRGNMVAAYTDPKTGYFVDAEGNPILDADGKPRKSDVPLAYDKEGNLLPGSEAPVFIRSEEALKRGEQRKNFNNRMQEARNSGNNLIMSFVSRDPETNDLKFDEAGFESQYPGSLPPPGPKRTEAISQLTNMIERGRAVQQNRDRLGRRQQESSPTFGPILMRESLQQAETPEEAAMLALYFNRPDIAQFYQQQAMGDRAILAEEQKARAAAEVRAAGVKGNDELNSPSAVSGDISRTIRDGIGSGNLGSARMSLTTGPNPTMTETEFNNTAFAMDMQNNPAAILKPMHRPVVEDAFEIADDGWKPVERWTDEEIVEAEQKFANELASRGNFTIDDDVRQTISRIFQDLWTQFYGDRKAYPRSSPKKTAGVGLPDDEQPGTQPGWVDAF